MMLSSSSNSRRVLKFFVFFLASFGAFHLPAHEDLTFVSWTGPYMRSQMLAYVRPFEAASGQRVGVERYEGGIDEIRHQVESANVTWDVVDLTQADSLRACEEGLLEEIDHSILPPGSDGTDYQSDFIEGALNPCGVGVIVWSTLYGYNKDLFSGEDAPSTIADFFDVGKYPGPRGLRRDPAVIMEWALLAAGVSEDQVYAQLQTEDGRAKAYEMLDQIKPYIVWWETANEPINLMQAGELAMSSFWSGEVVNASQQEGSKIDIVWDGRMIEMDLFGVVKGTRNKQTAMEFIKYASSSVALANQAKYISYGPTRKSSLSLISSSTRETLPNDPKYDDKASILSDAQWWAENYDVINEEFQRWLSAAAIQGASGTVR